MNNPLKPLSRAIIISSIVASFLTPSLSYSQTLNTSSQDQVAAIGAQLDTIKGLFNALLGKLSGTLGAQVSGGSSFATDTFTDTNNVLLQNHTADSGQAWVRHPSYSNNAIISSNTTRDQYGGSPVYYINANPSSSEYSVQVDVTGTSYVGGPVGRINISANTYYFVYWSSVSWRLYKSVNGVDTILGTYSGDSPSGVIRTIKLEIKDATKKVFINGTERISSPDNSITGPGMSGVVFSGVTSDTLDNFIAINLGASTPPPTDTTVPSQPANLTATAVSTSQINLSWNASTDNVGVTGYNIYRNNAQIASVANTSYNDTGLTASTLHSYYVRATDAAGNISTQSTSASATTQSSTTPPPTPAPTASLSASATLVVSGSSSTLTWSSTNTTSCTASGSWSGVKATSGLQTLTNLTTTGTYTLSCTGSGGTTSASVTVSVASTPPPSSSTFTFTATGDIGATATDVNNVQVTTQTLQHMASQNGSFTLALGDFSYDQVTPESAWCNYIKGIFGTTYPFMLIPGNHEDQPSGDNGYIVNFAACLPAQIPVTGTYGLEYYFDYPSVSPIARFIELPTYISKTYANGSADQAWLNTTIDQARAAGIKWIIVSMHMLCPTVGEKSCQGWNGSPGPDLFNFLVNKKVDLVLHSHDHNYQRSKQLALSSSCASIPVDSDATPGAVANVNCIVDSDDSLAKGAGTVIVISGITPNYRWPYEIYRAGETEGLYFKIAQNSDYGYTKVTVSPTQLTSQFIATGKPTGGSGTFVDSFTITESGTTPPPTPAPTASLSASATLVVSGSSSTLTWSSTNATSCTASGSWSGTKTTSGSQTLTNLTTTGTYTLSCTGSGGTANGSATVSVTTTTPPSTKFSLNDRVQVSSGPLNVRATASATGTLLGQQQISALGTVIGGPVLADGLNWWNINYDNAPDGWSAEDYLTKYTTTTPPPSTDCSATSVRCVDDTAGATQEYFTIQAAVNVAVAGDTILVHEGTYQGFGIRSKSGTVGNPITIRGVGRALINQMEPGGSGEFVYSTFSGYFTVENFEVDCTSGGSSSFCVGIHSGGQGANNGITIRGNKVYNGGSTNIYLSRTANSLIENNTSYGSRTSHGIYLSNDGADNTTIRGNHSYNNSKNGIHLNGDFCQGGDGIITGTVIENNILHNNGLHGVDMDGSQGTTLRNNLIYNNQLAGIVGFNYDGAGGPKNHVIYNNTILLASTNSQHAIEMKGGRDDCGSGLNTNDQGGHTIFNNILIAPGGGSISVGNVNFTSNNNIVSGNFSRDQDATTMSFAQWQASGYDTNSVVSTASSVFTNAIVNDYTLKVGSLAIDKGIATLNAISAPTTDIVGNARPQGASYDIGTYEYASGGTTPPPTPAPTVSLTASPTSVTSGNSATLSWSSTNATSCTGSGAWSGTKATSGSQTLTNLTTTGTYTISCTGSGGTASQSTMVTVTATSDTTTPAQPANFTATAVSSSQINLLWTASTDNVGVTGYDIYRNNTFLTTVTGTSYSNTGLASNTTYSYYVRAKDAAGNLSPQSASVSSTTQTADTTLPTITITSPTSATTYTTTTNSITLGGTASDNIGVTQVTWSNSTGGSGTGSGTTSWTATIPLQAGSNTITVAARDQVGNTGTDTNTVTYTVLDTTVPSVSLSSPASGAIISGAVTVSATASDNVGVTGVQFKFDGANLGAEDTASPYSVSWNTTTVANGTHTLIAVARDAGGNVTTSGSVSVTVSNTSPDTTAPSTPTNVTASAVSSSQIALSWSASFDPTIAGQTTSGISSYRIFRNNVQIATTIETSYNNTGLSPSTTYIYVIAAYDSAGNTSTQSSGVSATTQVTPVVSDTTAPVIAGVSAGNITSSSVSIIWSTNELATSRASYGTNNATLNQQVSGTSFINTHTISLENLTRRTTYSYRVNSSDTSGNTATSSTFTFTTSSGKPSKVRSLSASSGSVILSWKTPPNDFITGIAIYRSTTGYPSTTDTGALLANLPSSANTYRDTTTSAGTTYYYTVYTTDDLGVLSDPEYISFTTPGQSSGTTSGGGGGGGGSAPPSSGISTGSGGVVTPPSTSTTTTPPQTGTTTTPPQTGTTTTPGTTTIPSAPSQTFTTLTGPFSIGMRNDQVKLLQQMLIKDGSLGGEATGYYGLLTTQAVQKFQTKHNIVTSGTPSATGFGLAGPGTRAKLNALYQGSMSGGGGGSMDQETFIASLRKQVADLIVILQTLIAKLAALKAAQGVQ